MAAGEAFARLRSEEAGWVDGRVIRQMYEDMIRLYSRGGDAYIAFTGPLWAVASLELWLDGVAQSAMNVSSGNDRSSLTDRREKLSRTTTGHAETGTGRRAYVAPSCRVRLGAKLTQNGTDPSLTAAA